MTSPYDAALQDPEYLLFLAQQRAAAGRRQANYSAETTDLEAQYGTQTRDVERELPKQLQRGTEDSAGRGMLFSGGQLEGQGEIRGNAAGLLSKISGNKSRDLGGLLRSFTDANAGDVDDQQGALANAARRASERAMNAPITPGNGGAVGGEAPQAMAQQPVYMPPTTSPLTGRPDGANQAPDVNISGMTFGGGGYQPPTSPIQSGDNQTTLPQIQAATRGAPSQANATLSVNGTRVTTNAAGIINTRGPYYGKYPSQVGAR